MEVSAEVKLFNTFLDEEYGDDHLAKILAALIVDEKPVEAIKDIFSIIDEEVVNKYSFTRILIGGEDFKACVRVAYDDLYADFEFWKEGFTLI